MRIRIILSSIPLLAVAAWMLLVILWGDFGTFLGWWAD